MPLRNYNDPVVAKYAFVNPSTATDTSTIAAVTGKRFRILAVSLVAGGANNVYFKSGSTAISSTMNLAANGGFVLPYNPAGWFVTATSEALNLTTSAAVATGCSIVYEEII